MGTVGGLGFHGRIPPGVEVDDCVRASQIQAHAAGFEADEKNGDGVIGLEALDHCGAILG